MEWFRTIRGFVRLLVALFIVAQFAGVVSSPRANAQPAAHAMTAHGHHQHGHDHADKGTSHDRSDGGGNLADACCALHAYFNGVLPAAVGIEAGSVNGESLAVDPDDQGFGVPPGRLDRPPRPQC
jgi:hypothetical protein